MSLQKAILKEMNAHTAEMNELQEQFTTRGAKLSALLSRNDELADELH